MNKISRMGVAALGAGLVVSLSGMGAAFAYSTTDDTKPATHDVAASYDATAGMCTFTVTAKLKKYNKFGVEYPDATVTELKPTAAGLAVVKAEKRMKDDTKCTVAEFNKHGRVLEPVAPPAPVLLSNLNGDKSVTCVNGKYYVSVARLGLAGESITGTVLETNEKLPFVLSGDKSSFTLTSSKSNLCLEASGTAQLLGGDVVPWKFVPSYQEPGFTVTCSVKDGKATLVVTQTSGSNLASVILSQDKFPLFLAANGTADFPQWVASYEFNQVPALLHIEWATKVASGKISYMNACAPVAKVSAEKAGKAGKNKAAGFANTGADFGPLALVALLSMVAGAGVVVSRRRFQ